MMYGISFRIAARANFRKVIFSLINHSCDSLLHYVNVYARTHVHARTYPLDPELSKLI